MSCAERPSPFFKAANWLVSRVANTSMWTLASYLNTFLKSITVRGQSTSLPLMRIVAGKANSNRSNSLGRNFIILKSESERPHSVGCERRVASVTITRTHAQKTLRGRCCGIVCYSSKWVSPSAVLSLLLKLSPGVVEITRCDVTEIWLRLKTTGCGWRLVWGCVKVKTP